MLSPEGVVLVTSPGAESSYPRPPQSLKHSFRQLNSGNEFEIYCSVVTRANFRSIEQSNMVVSQLSARLSLMVAVVIGKAEGLLSSSLRKDE